MRYEDYVPGMLVRLNDRAKSKKDIGRLGSIVLAYPDKEYAPEAIRSGEILAEFTPEDGSSYTQYYYLYRMDIEPCQLELFKE